MTEQFQMERTAPIGTFLTIAAMHLKEGHNDEAEKVMRSAENAGRKDDADKIRKMIEEVN